MEEEEEMREVQYQHHRQLETLEFINHHFLSFHKSVTNKSLYLELSKRPAGPLSNSKVEGNQLPKTPDDRIPNHYSEKESDFRASPVLDERMYDDLKTLSNLAKENGDKENLKSHYENETVLSSSPQNSFDSINSWDLVLERGDFGVQRFNFSNETLPLDLTHDYESKVIEFRRKKINCAKILALEWLTLLSNYNVTLQQSKSLVGLLPRYFLRWRNALQSRVQAESAILSRPSMKSSREIDLFYHNQIRNTGQDFQYYSQNPFVPETQDYSPLLGNNTIPFDSVQDPLYREPSYDNFLSCSENFDDIRIPPWHRRDRGGLSRNVPSINPSNFHGIHEPFGYDITPARSKNLGHAIHTRHSSHHSLSRKSSDTKVSGSNFYSFDDGLSRIIDNQRRSPREANPLASRGQVNKSNDYSKFCTLLASGSAKSKISGPDRFKSHVDYGPTTISTKTAIHYNRDLNDIDCALSDLSLSDELQMRDPALFRLYSSDCKRFEIQRLTILERRCLQLWRQELQNREQKRLARTGTFHSTTPRKDRGISSRRSSPNQTGTRRFGSAGNFPERGASNLRNHIVDQNGRDPARDEVLGGERPGLYMNRNDVISPTYPGRNHKAMPLVHQEKVSASALNELKVVEHIRLAGQYRKSSLIKKILDTWKSQSTIYLSIRFCFNDAPTALLHHIRPAALSNILCYQIRQFLYSRQRSLLEVSFKKFRCSTLLERRCVEARHIMEVCSLKGAMDFWIRETKKKVKVEIISGCNRTVSLNLQSSRPEDPVYEKRLERKATDFRKRRLLQHHFEAWRWIRAQHHSMLQSTQEIYTRNLVALSFDTWLRKSREQVSYRTSQMVEAAQWGDQQAILRTFQVWLTYTRHHHH